MESTRPGIERITKQWLQSAKTNLTQAIYDHVKGCAICHKAGKAADPHCQQWWSLSMDLYRVNRKLRQYQYPDVSGMDQLPGMDAITDGGS